MSKRRKEKIIVVRSGSLIDGTGAKPKKNSVVVVEGARIKAVGKEGEVWLVVNTTDRKTFGSYPFNNTMYRDMYFEFMIPTDIYEGAEIPFLGDYYKGIVIDADNMYLYGTQYPVWVISRIISSPQQAVCKFEASSGILLWENVTNTEDQKNIGTYSLVSARIGDFEIIPEFPSFLILPLFMIATLLAVILYRRKHSVQKQKRSSLNSNRTSSP